MTLRTTRFVPKPASSPSPTSPRKVLRVADASQYCGVSTSMLNKLRVRGDGPRFVRLGRRTIGYDMNDLAEWLELRKVRSTSERPKS